MYDCYWYLEYGDGAIYREDPNGGSIKAADANAVLLLLVTPQGQVAAKVRLVVDGVVWRPVFYRIRSLSAASMAAQPQTVCTVFGRAREQDNEIEATLLCAQNGRIGPVAEEHLDKGAVASQCCETWTAPVALLPV